VAKVGRGRVGADRVYPTAPTCNGAGGWVEQVVRLVDWDRSPLAQCSGAKEWTGSQKEKESAGFWTHWLGGPTHGQRAAADISVLHGYVTAIVAGVAIDKWYRGLQASADRARAHSNSSDPPRTNLRKRSRHVGF